jgi:hypothetical protein
MPYRRSEANSERAVSGWNPQAETGRLNLDRQLREIGLSPDHKRFAVKEPSKQYSAKDARRTGGSSGVLFSLESVPSPGYRVQIGIR